MTKQTVITDKPPDSDNKTAEILAEIAALPLAGSSDAFAGREHDSILYPSNNEESQRCITR